MARPGLGGEARVLLEIALFERDDRSYLITCVRRNSLDKTESDPLS